MEIQKVFLYLYCQRELITLNFNHKNNHKMKNLEKQKANLNETLRYYNFDANYFALPIDGRLGKKYAIASNTEFGGLQTHSDYMTVKEFKCYLSGFDACKRNTFVINSTN